MAVDQTVQQPDLQQSHKKSLNGQHQHKEYDVFTGNPELIKPPATNAEHHDFIWSLNEEPHFSRRKEILKKYPQIQKLFGTDPNLKWAILGIFTIQLVCAWVFRDSLSYQSPWFWLTAFVVGGTANQALFLAIHEMSHNLAFKSIQANKLYSILVANVPIGFPYAASFKPYHMDHHKYQGVAGVDTDLPSELEGHLFSSTVGKMFFAFFQIFFYALRPVLTRQQPLTLYHLLNVVYIFGVDYLLYKYVGLGCVVYFVTSTFLAGCGLHPCASHFIAEHYVFTGDWETYSYYGILNYLCFNVGYHNEHHDFPNIPGSRLPILRKIASEYYDNLPYHESWPMVTWKFVFDKNIGVWNRVKRKGNVRLQMQENVRREETEQELKGQ